MEERGTDGGGDLVAEGEDNSVTMVDVLKNQEELEKDAYAVLGGSDDKECTYSKGYVKRQALYACLTCCSDSRTDPTQWAGICLACSLACHENHNLVELYTKRNFRCDCGGPKFANQPCVLNKGKVEPNTNNVYNQNFGGLYCVCHRPYPDPESTDDDEMIQCIICEDWLHSKHLEAVVPCNELYSEMICEQCMDSKKFLRDYTMYTLEDQTIENKIESEQTTISNIYAEPKEAMEVDESNLISENNDMLKINQSKPDIVLSALSGNGTPENKSNELTSLIEPSKMDIDLPSESVNVDVTDENLVKPSDSDKEMNESNKVNDLKMMQTDSQSGEVEPSKSSDEPERIDEVGLKSAQPALDQTLKDQSSKTDAPLLPQTNDGEINSTENNADVKDNLSSSGTDIESINESTSEENVNKEGLCVDEVEKNEPNKQEKLYDNVKSPDNTSDLNEDKSEIIKEEKSDTKAEQENELLKNTKGDTPCSLREESNKDKEKPADVLEESTKENEKLSGVDLESINENEKPSNVDLESIKENEKPFDVDLESIKENKKPSEVDLESIEENEKPSGVHVESITENDKPSDVQVESSKENDKPFDIQEVSGKDDKDSNKIDHLIETDDGQKILETKQSEKESDIENEVAVENRTLCKIVDINLDLKQDENCETKNIDVEKPMKKSLDADSVGTDSDNVDKLAPKEVTTNNTSNEICSKDIMDGDMQETETEHSENQKRKLNSEDSNINVPNKKCKIDINGDQPVVSCKRPSSSKRNKGATFWPCSWRKKLCSCINCVAMYRDENVLFLLDDEDTVSAYEDLGKSKCHSSQYEKGLKALSSLDRIQQINALTEYNNMKEKLLDFLKTFKEKKEVVRDEDIKKFFAGMKPKREPDGVYFCR